MLAIEGEMLCYTNIDVKYYTNTMLHVCLCTKAKSDQLVYIQFCFLAPMTENPN